MRTSRLCALAVLLLLPFLAPPAGAADVYAGHWEGTMISHGQPLAVTFDFATGAKGPEGRFTSFTQRAMEYPLDSVTVGGSALKFVLGGSLTFDGTVSGDTMSGTFTSDDSAGTFKLARTAPPLLPYDTVDVSFRNGDVVLKGTLCLPRTPGRHPAVVMVHGSGPESRWGTNRYIADRFARAGIAALVFDKRGSGESGGDWRKSGYEDLARDGLAGVDLLAARAEIDAKRIGVMGHSQGGAVAPLMAALAPNKIAFLVAEDTFTGPQWHQDIYRVGNGIDELGLSPQDKAKAMEVYGLFVDAARGARPAADFEAAAAPYLKTNWYAWLALPPPGTWVWDWYRKTGDFDTLPSWRTVRVPVLLVYGEKDALVPVDSSIADIEGALDTSGAPYTAIIAPNAQHNLTVQPDPKGPFFWWHAAPGLIDMVVAWVSQTTARN